MIFLEMLSHFRPGQKLNEKKKKALEVHDVNVSHSAEGAGKTVKACKKRQSEENCGQNETQSSLN